MYRVAPESFDALMELSYATNTLGSLAMDLQEFEQAAAFFRSLYHSSCSRKISSLAIQPYLPILPIPDLGWPVRR